MSDDIGKYSAPALDKYSAPALDKGLDILELLSLATEPLSMGQIADQLSRSKGEIFRMLVALERRGYILRNPDSDRFEIGSRLFEMAMHVTPTRNLVATAMRHIEKVAHELDQSCHLAVLSGTQIVVIARVEAPGEVGFAVRLGYRRRIDHSTSGRVITAFSSAPQRDAIMARLAAEHPDFDRAGFEARLAKVAADGHDRGPSLSVAGVTDIGAPVLGDTGWSVGSLTIPFIQRAGSAVTIAQARDVLLREAAIMSSDLSLGMPRAAAQPTFAQRR
jgi:DNA-binding IclR family transcriptional regulator